MVLGILCGWVAQTTRTARRGLPSPPRPRRLGSMRSGWCSSWASFHWLRVSVIEPGPFLLFVDRTPLRPLDDTYTVCCDNRNSQVV
jgi:hypothetical protein